MSLKNIELDKRLERNPVVPVDNRPEDICSTTTDGSTHILAEFELPKSLIHHINYEVMGVSTDPMDCMYVKKTSIYCDTINKGRANISALGNSRWVATDVIIKKDKTDFLSIRAIGQEGVVINWKVRYFVMSI